MISMNPIENPTDPDPPRSSRDAIVHHAIVHHAISLHWSRAAGLEYSRLEGAPPRVAVSALVRRAARQTLNAPLLFDLPSRSFALDISFVCDAEILELNSSHRNKSKPTDVLSFSQLEGGAMPFGGDEIMLGDVIISIETASRQAQELKHSLLHEIAFLTAHGTLHLCGYDHDTSAKRRAMWKQQDEIVSLLNLAPQPPTPNP